MPTTAREWGILTARPLSYSTTKRLNSVFCPRKTGWWVGRTLPYTFFLTVTHNQSNTDSCPSIVSSIVTHRKPNKPQPSERNGRVPRACMCVESGPVTRIYDCSSCNTASRERERLLNLRSDPEQNGERMKQMIKRRELFCNWPPAKGWEWGSKNSTTYRHCVLRRWDQHVPQTPPLPLPPEPAAGQRKLGRTGEGLLVRWRRTVLGMTGVGWSDGGKKW